MYTTEKKPLLFIAGGIGITPYRALVGELLSNPKALPKEVHLLYMDSKKQLIYTEELDKAGKETPIKTSYLANRQDLYQQIDDFVNEHSNEGEYFVAGAKSMAKSIEKALKNKGIKKNNIKMDPFIGY